MGRTALAGLRRRLRWLGLQAGHFPLRVAHNAAAAPYVGQCQNRR